MKGLALKYPSCVAMVTRGQANSGKLKGSHITLGARGDSYYEYLLKQWLQSGKTDTRWKDMYMYSTSAHDCVGVCVCMKYAQMLIPTTVCVAHA